MIDERKTPWFGALNYSIRVIIYKIFFSDDGRALGLDQRRRSVERFGERNLQREICRGTGEFAAETETLELESKCCLELAFSKENGSSLLTSKRR